MLFWHLCILGVIMGWVSDATRSSPTFVSEKRQELSGVDTKVLSEVPPAIPEFYKRPNLIPVLEPDDTPLIADAYLRAGGGG